jgi:hypothetical protein
MGVSYPGTPWASVNSLRSCSIESIKIFLRDRFSTRSSFHKSSYGDAGEPYPAHIPGPYAIETPKTSIKPEKRRNNT